MHRRRPVLAALLWTPVPPRCDECHMHTVARRHLQPGHLEVEGTDGRVGRLRRARNQLALERPALRARPAEEWLAGDTVDRVGYGRPTVDRLPLARRPVDCVGIEADHDAELVDGGSSVRTVVRGVVSIHPHMDGATHGEGAMHHRHRLRLSHVSEREAERPSSVGWVVGVATIANTPRWRRGWWCGGLWRRGWWWRGGRRGRWWRRRGWRGRRWRRRRRGWRWGTRWRGRRWWRGGRWR